MAKLTIKTKGGYEIPIADIISSNLEMLQYLADVVNNVGDFKCPAPQPDGNDKPQQHTGFTPRKEKSVFD